eukprot:Hpha_TRINITY_DN15018_c10_g1::TRINITY_DN15018_c10_g1_i6::g.124787::m.124787
MRWLEDSKNQHIKSEDKGGGEVYPPYPPVFASFCFGRKGVARGGGVRAFVLLLSHPRSRNRAGEVQIVERGTEERITHLGLGGWGGRSDICLPLPFPSSPLVVPSCWPPRSFPSPFLDLPTVPSSPLVV